MRAVIRGTPVHAVEETAYPFRGVVKLTVNPDAPASFPLSLRVPGWAAGAAIRVNGRAEQPPAPGTFARVERTWRAGDEVEIEFPMRPRVSRWFHGSVAIERGPVVFSYGIGESWLKLRDRGMTADWQVFPTTQWNYGLCVKESAPEESISVHEMEPSGHVFTARATPVRLSVKARELPDWRAEDGAANPVPQSPVETDQPVETITLIPYAAAKLRITAFPQCKM